MQAYKIKIELVSDLCVSDGGVYNSMLDTDICYDSLGFPFIPAKRLRGCLRECALELNDWGKNIPLEKLFGTKGNEAASIRIGDAYLEEYEQMKEPVLKNRNSPILHPQNILNHFSYIRTQTSIDYKTGVANAASLRTMRVAKKGLKFLANVDFVNKKEEASCKEGLEMCCRILKHMGVSRTRGMGEVKVSLLSVEEKITEESKTLWKEGDNRLEYSIYLEEPLICKSVNGGESRTLDYIEGSKILGLLAGQMKRNGEDLLELLNEEELFFSNAYLEKNHTRLLEVPAVFYQIKNNDKVCINKLYETEKNKEQVKDKQIEQIRHCYIGTVFEDGKDKLLKYDVEIEERYHHRRPEDKSIGRASEEESGDSHFYQMSSILAGQSFQGYITGNASQIERIYKLLNSQTQYYLGYSRSSEYGKIDFQITNTLKRKEPERRLLQNFTVKLESPAILYSSYAMATTDVKVLIEEINALMEIDSENIANIERYVKYTSVGGYNVTWQARKPVLEVFDKGTVLVYQLKEPAEVLVADTFYIGERLTEGFGETTVTELEKTNNLYEMEIVKPKESSLEKIKGNASDFVTSICDDLWEDYIRAYAMSDAGKIKVTGKETLNATVRNLLLMCKETSSLEKIREIAQERYNKNTGTKKDKLKNAEDILSTIPQKCKRLLEQFICQYHIIEGTYQPSKERYEYLYLESYLNGLKFYLKKERGRNHEGK